MKADSYKVMSGVLTLRFQVQTFAAIYCAHACIAYDMSGEKVEAFHLDAIVSLSLSSYVFIGLWTSSIL